jgi:hypothetical protein
MLTPGEVLFDGATQKVGGFSEMVRALYSCTVAGNLSVSISADKIDGLR